MNITHAEAWQLEITDLHQIFSYRHSVFVDRLKWDLPIAEVGLEIDQFDRNDTCHVVARDASDDIVGYARLLPTTEPYLLSEVFPQLMAGQTIPKSPVVWELSRFCSVDLRAASDRQRQADFWGCQLMLRAAVQCALEHGATHLIAVSAVAMERILSRLGVNAYRASQTMQLHGHSVFAFWIELDNITKNALDIACHEEVFTHSTGIYTNMYGNDNVSALE